MEKVFIPRQNIEALKKKFKKAAKKAVKLNMPAPQLFIFEDEMETEEFIVETANSRRKVKLAMIPVSCTGEIPIVKGWNLAAAIEHSRITENEVNYNTVRMVPGFETNSDLRTLPPTCDHCNHNRYRKTTYLLHNSESGKYFRVGSSCLKDFLGDVNPEYILNAAEHTRFLDSFLNEFEFEPSFSYQNEYPIEEVLAITNAEIRANGWLSRGKASETGDLATADAVYDIMTAPYDMLLNHQLKIIKSVNEFDAQLAKDALAWIGSFDLADPSLNDYIYNSALCAKRLTLTQKDFGIGCSIIASYKNKLAKEVAQNEKAKLEKDSEFFGDIKERIRDLNVTFLNSWSFDSSFGVSTISKFVTDDGNIVIWKTGGTNDFVAGEKMKITGTVKEHKIFRDVKQTILTRCKLTFEE